MDVQTENMDPPPCESQPSGKIRKGFKLFGKRKPGNIFSIRSKGDGNNKSPVKSKTLDGLSESAAPDLEQESEKEKAEEEPLGEDGVLAAAPARTSISSASSAKSLSFLSLLRGGRRGVGDRRVHTVSQPVGRQRRGLKGLFGNVKFRSKDKEDKEEAPPSPLLMSSRANSVEIIKEDLTLTPKSQPRSPDSSENESCTPVKSFTTQDSAATSPSKTITPQVTAGNVTPPPVIASVSRPSPVAAPPPVSAKPPPLTRGPPTPVAFTQPPPTKLDSATSLNLQTSTTYKPSLSSAAGESKTPVTVPSACAVTTKPSFTAPVIPSKITAVPTTTTPSTTTSGSVSVALSKPTVTPRSKDKVSNVEFNVPTLKHTQEESHQPPQPKVLTSLPRDSKIPVKHGAQSHTASQIPQAKEPPRTKIPVSKVPVRRVGNKPAVAGGSTQIRK
uniref:Nascent polypeptide-associated complex subunit alpha, muscle-specific form-like n=1 Tax=Seriola dumerili TaxID=41447 RepID=A0A3B4TQD5_SERDU